MLQTKNASTLLEAPNTFAALGAPVASASSARSLVAMPLSKWLFDKSLAIIGLAVLSPVMLGVACAIRLGGPGPVTYGHTRIGKNGVPFKCLKFRTMRPGSDDALIELLDIDPIARDEWNEQRKLERDPRVDSVGMFLRKTSLDELPQFWNVLRGDMSIVGPRPITADEMSKYGTHIAAYKSVRPGITGIWQVSGRSDASYERRVALDTDYVNTRNFRTDVSIVLRTFKVVASRRGAV